MRLVDEKKDTWACRTLTGPWLVRWGMGNGEWGIWAIECDRIIYWLADPVSHQDSINFHR
jgi:hypothetical protein